MESTFKTAILKPSTQIAQCLRELLNVIEHNKPFNLRALRDEVQIPSQTPGLQGIVIGYRTTQDRSCVLVHARQGEVQDLTTNIVEEHIKITNGLLEFFVERRALVVESLVYAEFVFQPLALVRRSGDRVDLCTLLLAKLTDD